VAAGGSPPPPPPRAPAPPAALVPVLDWAGLVEEPVLVLDVGSLRQPPQKELFFNGRCVPTPARRAVSVRRHGTPAPSHCAVAPALQARPLRGHAAAVRQVVQRGESRQPGWGIVRARAHARAGGGGGAPPEPSVRFIPAAP